MAFIESDGFSIHYEVIGNGRPLVLQHGFTMSLKRWHIDGYVDALRDRYQLILIDARGHGQSAKPYDPEPYAIEHMAGDVLAVLDAVGAGHCAYWGFSMGGAIGFGLASIAPARFGAFILGGMHPYGREIPASANVSGDDPKAFAEAFMRRIGLDPETMPPKYRDLMLDNDFRALAAAQQDRPSQEAALAKMDMPVLMFAGGADPMHDQAKQAASEIADCTFLTVDDLDHAATFRESARVLPHINAFLAHAYPPA